MRKEDKGVIIAQLGDMLKQYPHFYMVDVEGMNAGDTSDLRRKCFKNGIKMMVVKNSLMETALEADERDFAEFKDCLKGTTAMLFTETAAAPARMIKEINSKKQEKPALKAAYAEEMAYIGADKLATLSALKSKNELIADVIAALESPIMNVLSALENKENAEAPAAETPAAE